MFCQRIGRNRFMGPLLMFIGLILIICNLPLCFWLIILGIGLMIFGSCICR